MHRTNRALTSSNSELTGVDHEFVVHLHDQLAFHALHLLRHVDHRDLDDVRRRTLNGGVDGVSLCKCTNHGVVAEDVGQGPTATQQGGGMACLSCTGHTVFGEVVESRELRVVRFDDALGLLPGDAQIFSQPEGALARRGCQNSPLWLGCVAHE